MTSATTPFRYLWPLARIRFENDRCRSKLQDNGEMVTVIAHVIVFLEERCFINSASIYPAENKRYHGNERPEEKILLTVLIAAAYVFRWLCIPRRKFCFYDSLGVSFDSKYVSSGREKDKKCSMENKMLVSVFWNILNF